MRPCWKCGAAVPQADVFCIVCEQAQPLLEHTRWFQTRPPTKRQESPARAADLRARIVLAGTIALLAGLLVAGLWWANVSEPSDAVPQAVVAAGTTSIKVGGEPFGGLALFANAANPIDGKRPELHVACDSHRSVSLMLDVVQQPLGGPPPLRGVFATLAVDEQPPAPMEMGWGTQAMWMPRELSELDERRLALAISRARRVTFVLPAWLGPSRVVWTVNLPKHERERFARQCRAPTQTRTRSPSQ